MQYRYLFLLLCLYVSFNGKLRSQITADSVPPGMFAVNPFINLSVSPCTTYDSTLYDINCDGNIDFSFILYKGATVIDGANFVWLRVVNDSFEICKDTGGMYSGYPRPHYYNTGDPLVAAANSMWGNDAYYQFGDYGCMSCTGPNTQSSAFIAFRKAGQEGWMKVSFNLIDGGSCSAIISFNVASVLSPCLGNAIDEQNSESTFSIAPNPFTAMTVLTTDQPLSSGVLKIYNATGQVVREQSCLHGSVFVLEREMLPEGMYLITLADGGEPVSYDRVIIGGN